MADEGFTFSMGPRVRIASGYRALRLSSPIGIDVAGSARKMPALSSARGYPVTENDHFPDGGEDNLCAATGAGGEYGTEATVGLGKPLSE
jgi:hypothetical protein